MQQPAPEGTQRFTEHASHLVGRGTRCDSSLKPPRTCGSTSPFAVVGFQLVSRHLKSSGYASRSGSGTLILPARTRDPATLPRGHPSGSLADMDWLCNPDWHCCRERCKSVCQKSVSSEQQWVYKSFPYSRRTAATSAELVGCPRRNAQISCLRTASRRRSVPTATARSPKNPNPNSPMLAGSGTADTLV